MFEPNLDCFTFLLCSFFLVSKALPVSPMQLQEQSAQLILYTTLVCFSGSGLSFGDGKPWWCCGSGLSFGDGKSIVANLCMEEIEELAFNQTDTPPKKWLSFVDYVFSIIKKHAITNFHNLLNSIDPHINFTIEREQNGQLSFLDTMVTRNNGSLNVNVYRKPTHTDRYLDYNSHHDKQHKITSTARTLLHRAAHLPNTNEGKRQEKDRVFDALRSNGYPKIFLDEVEKRRARPKQNSCHHPKNLYVHFLKMSNQRTIPATQSSPTLTAQRNP